MALPSTVQTRAPERAVRRATVCLAGNPNVGKSTLFNALTGAAVETANYAGMTVETTAIQVSWEGQPLEIVDLPGAYALSIGEGEGRTDERVARQALLERRPDVVIAVADATNLARNLYLVLQLLDLGFRVVVALNFMDEARRRDVRIDRMALQEALGVPVVRTVAVRGEGIADVKAAVVEMVRAGAGAEPDGSAPAPARTAAVRYSDVVRARREALVERLEARPDPLPYGLSAHATALAILEGDTRLAQAAGVESPEGGVSDDEPPIGLRIAAERYAAARALARACTETHAAAPPDRAWRVATAPVTGPLILVAVVAAVFAVLFFVGDALSTGLTDLWSATASPALTAGVHALLGSGWIGGTVLWGIDGGILATLAVGIPYILTFYVIMAVLEETGYMNAAAYLSDRIMHHFGLHGRAVIPLIAAGGCNVPAILGTRVLSTMRERVIASILIVLVPCSARTAVIMGAVAKYAGWQWAVLVYGVVFVVGVSAGILLDRMLPGQAEGLVMEIFPMRRPVVRNVARKTWRRFRDFVWVAAPIILGGSLALGALYETGLIWYAEGPLRPVVSGWLGLPAVAGLVLIFAVLRKELALQLLVVFAVARYGASASDLRNFMSAHQLVVFAIVNSIYIPCVATIAMLARELGWQRAAYISVGTIATALVVGGAVAHVLPFV